MTVGEDLSSYELVLTFLAPITGFICKHTLGALWALHSCPNTVIAFDDWQTAAVWSSAKGALGRWDKILAEDPFGYAGLDKAGPYKVQLLEALTRLAAGDWDWHALVPVYVGGDLKKLGVPAKKIFPFNPSCLFKGHYGWVDEHAYVSKKQQWVLAALHDHTAWAMKLGVVWPIDSYGCRKLKQPRVTEKELFEVYKQSAGVLSPEYKKSCGSGWWRARYGFAADALSIILGNPAELAMVDPTAYGKTAAQIEGMAEADRHNLAVAQREAYYKAAGTYEDMIHHIAAAMP